MSLATKCTCQMSSNGFCNSSVKQCTQLINMSDALQHTPSFSEMVSLIERLFKISLESTKAFTTYEIEQEWQRYKTLNHLYQDERQEGPVWVKASERLPGYETPVKWRDGNDHSHAIDGKIPLIHMAKPFLTGWEWLDESQLKEGNKEREVAFAEWLIDDGWKPRITHEWSRYETMYSDVQVKTTEQLWNEWNQQNRNDEAGKNKSYLFNGKTTKGKRISTLNIGNVYKAIEDNGIAIKIKNNRGIKKWYYKEFFTESNKSKTNDTRRTNAPQV